MKKKQVSIILSVLFFLCVIGISYAYFFGHINNVESASTILGNSGKFELTYADGTGTLTGTEVAPGWSASKTFTVTNTGKGRAGFNIYLSNIVNNFIAGSLACEVKDSTSTVVASGNVPTSAGSITGSIYLNTGASMVYTLTVSYVNLDIDQTSDIGKTFSFTVGITSIT